MSNKPSHGTLCPACGEGNLSSSSNLAPLSYKGVEEDVPYYFSSCDSCGSELADKSDIVKNNRIANAFYKKVDGFLSGTDLKQLRKHYGLTQEQSALLFGGGKVAFSRYENDDICQSSAMDSLIRLCLDNPYNFILLAKNKKVSLSSEIHDRIESEYYQGIKRNAAYIQAVLEDDLNSKVGITTMPCANEEFEDDNIIYLHWANS
jgi:HTH-type transcriptional regulator/antitoxin MqsA